jgi:predicted nucleotidyltransferase
MALSEARVAEVRTVIERLTAYATSRDEVRGLVLVGSWARRAARMDSDVDVVVLAAEPAALPAEVWLDLLAAGRVVRRQWWGPLDEIRVALPSGLEVEVGIVPLSWAATDPVDPGTRRVISDGHRVLYDPDGLLGRLAAACWP